jgi:basic membrane protein A and related proteins
MRLGLWLGIAALIVVLAGCSTAGRQDAGQNQAAIGMVTDTGGIGDESFNKMAWVGLQRAERELGVKAVKVESLRLADYAPNLQRLAERRCKVVFAVGFALKDAVADVAPRYPETRFAIIDADAPALDNCVGLVFREEEGSFLVGALAGGMSKKAMLGFVGGKEVPLIKRFEAGYRAGVKTTNPKAEVIAKYTNDWQSVDKGKELALSLFDQGADIVYHASGRCGLGVIQAARLKGPGFWAIGVDADQDALGTSDPNNPAPPSRVLTSMMKRIDNAVFTVCKEVSEGGFQSGTRQFGVKEDGVGLSPLKYTRAEIPEPLLKEVERLRGEITDGRVKPPRTLEDLQEWNPPVVRF